MKKILIAMLVIYLAVFTISCTPSVGKRIINKNQIEPSITVGGSFFEYLPFPAPLPNIGIDLKYGIFDNINIGINVHPVMLTFNTLLLAPYTCFSIYKSENTLIPSLNGYFSINTLTHFNPLGLVIYPLIGIVNIWKINNIAVYVPLETSFDFYSQIRKVKFNAGLGTEIPITERFYFSVEFRINSIGNIYLPLATMIGVPNLFISFSYIFN